LIKEISIKLIPEDITDEKKIVGKIKSELNLSNAFEYEIVKKSVDARNRNQVYWIYKILVYIDEIKPQKSIESPVFIENFNDKKAIVIGAGPAGLFAAIELLKNGVKPIILERGKDVRSRRRDLALINQKHIVNPESNYCYGEGGAGTYSDGKLYTRSTKRGDVNEVLNTLIHFGASEEIAVLAHPHIGTNKLPKIIENIRNTIIEKGGEVRFEAKVSNFKIENNQIKGVFCGEELIEAENVILATGHSARDIFELLESKNILIEAKPFAMGVRIEHPQELIDEIQYHKKQRSEYLPPASYSLVEQVAGRGVYSFCMCPGGIIAPCATSPGEVVTNGWSPSKRNNPYANSGIVVSIEKEDFLKYKHLGNLSGLAFQKELEKKAWEFGGKTQTAPAQRMVDFVKNKVSSDLPKCSYQPGIVSTNLHEVLPKVISERLQKAFVKFGEKMKGYYTKEAVLVGVESRTSSPVKIPRDKENLMHPQIKGLFPCGEGAGYAGGIVSAAIDGIKCARAIKVNMA
jgi:uncharacterized protein